MNQFFKHFCAAVSAAALAVSGLTCVPAGAAEENFLLSGNTLTASDKTLYGELQELQTGADYSWVSDESTDPDLMSNDSSHTKLQDGQLQTNDSKAIVFGKWSKGLCGTVVFDLKGSYIISQVDVWSSCGKSGSNIKKMADFEVSVSADNSAFTSLGTITNATPSTDYTTYTMVNTSGDFSGNAAAKGRYVKVKMNGASASTQNVISEVLIFGREASDIPVQTVDTAELEMLLATVRDYGSAHYTPVSYQAFSEAVSKAEAALEKKESQDAVNTAVSDLETAIAGLERSFEQFVLSENKFTNADQSIYSQTKLNTGATYSWLTTEPYDAAFSESDAANSKMTGGAVTGMSSSYITYGKWASHKSGAVIFDLKKAYDISQVDVWAYYHAAGGREMSDFSVAFSRDGVSYSEPLTFTNYRNTAGYVQEGESGAAVKTMGQFEPQKAQYVKIIMNPASGANQLNLGEVVILGADSAVDKTELNQLISKVETYSAKLYTAESFAALTEQLERAKSVAQNDDASKSEVDAACAALSSAVSGLVPSVQTGILSDNAFSTAVDTQEYGEAKKITTNVQYRYGEGTDPDIVKNDSKYNILKSGNVAAMDGSYVTTSKWYNTSSDPAKADVIYEFDKLYYINRVDLWSLYYNPGNRRAVDEYTVSVSINGVDWTEVASAVNESNIAENNNSMVVTKAEFPLSQAKYVKVSIPKGKGASAFILGEIVLFGAEAVGESIVEFDFTKLNYTDGGGSALTSLQGATEINIEAVVKNNSAAAKEVTVIAGLYDDEGKLTTMNFDTQNIAVGGTGSTYHLALSGLSGVTGQYRLKVFAWEGMSKCVPLAVVQEFGK